MNVELQRVKLEEREILSNLLEKYDYEFSQYDNRDVNKLGLYGYQYLDYYWTEKIDGHILSLWMGILRDLLWL